MDATSIPFGTNVRNVSTVARFANLLRKELHESRVVILIGACIFFAMPTLWGLIYLAIDSHHKPGMPFALFLSVGVGWLYAIIVGAHTVCRDWGRPEEYFLLARPLSPRMAIGAKLLAGLIVLTIIGLFVGLADTFTFVIPKGGDQLGRTEHLTVCWAAGYVVLLMIGGYLLAFVAAVMTRQMLTSTLLAVLVLVIWYAAPLIFQPLDFLHPAVGGHSTRFYMTFIRPTWLTANLPFICAVLLCVIAAVSLSFAAAGWERTFRLGHKTLAWVFAVVILALFAGAMLEVGNSLTVMDVAVVPRSGDPAMASISHWLLVSKGDRCLAMPAYDPMRASEDKRRNMNYKSFITFRVDELARIRDLRTATLCYSLDPDETLLPAGVKFCHRVNFRFIRYLSDFDVSPQGDWVIKGLLCDASPPQVFKMGLSWQTDGEPRVKSLQFAVPSQDNRYHAGTYRGDLVLLRFAATNRHAYCEYAVRENRPSVVNPYTHPRVLYVFDWVDTDSLDQPIFPSQILMEDSPQYRAWMEAGKGDKQFEALQWHGPASFHEINVGGSGTAQTRDLYPADWSPMPALAASHDSGLPGLMARQATETALGGTDYYKIAWDERRNLAIIRDTQGLRFFEPSPEGPKAVGAFLASPLSMALRRQTISLAMLDDHRLAELDASSLMLYEMTDPSNPRRIGFFNVRGWNPQVFEVNGRIVLRHMLGANQQEQLLVLDKR